MDIRLLFEFGGNPQIVARKLGRKLEGNWKEIEKKLEEIGVKGNWKGNWGNWDSCMKQLIKFCDPDTTTFKDVD